MTEAKNQHSKDPQMANHHVVEKLKPSDINEKISPPKKRHGFRNFLIVLIIVILVIIIGVGATGVYNVPLVSSIFGFNKPKDLGVTTSPEALASLKEKVPMIITSEKVDYSSGDKDIFTGELPVDTEFTANEVTSWLRRHQNPDPIITDLQVRQYEGGLEISGMINKYVKAPVYAKVNVNLVNADTIDLEFVKGKVGLFSIPDNYLDQAEKYFEDTVNSLIARVPGFSIEKYELHDGYSVFKGTFPESVKSSPQGWADLMNY